MAADQSNKPVNTSQRSASSISVDDLVEATTAGVMRALEARRAPIGVGPGGVRGPILWGIVWYPDDQNTSVFQTGGSPAPDVSKPFVTQNVAQFPSKLATTKAGGGQAIRVSRVENDLHLEQLDAHGRTIVGFVLHPITDGAKKKVKAVSITQLGQNQKATRLEPAERAALAVIVDELKQFKADAAPDGPGVIYFWHELWGAIDAGIACGLAGVEGGLNPLADAGCAVAAGLMLSDDDDD